MKGYRVVLPVLGIACYELFLLALPHRPAAIIDNLMQVLLTGGAALGCTWFATRFQGWERAWRILLVIGLSATTTGQAIWTWRQVFVPGHEIKPSWADLPYVVVVPVAIAAFLIIARYVSAPIARNESGLGRALQEARLCIDSLLVVGSLLLVAWMTTLDTIAEKGSTSRMAVALAFWYPGSDILIVAMVLLVYVTRFIPRRNLRQLSLIAAGFAATAISDVVFSYYLAGRAEYDGGGAGDYPLIGDLGYFVGPVLLTWAAASRDFRPAVSAARHSPGRSTPRIPTWPHIPLLVAAIFLSGKLIAGRKLTAVEAISAVGIFLLVVLHQLVAFASNRLRQASDAEQARASFEDAIQQVLDDAEPSPESSLERLLRPHIQFLSDEHRRRIENLQRSGNRMALWTFAGGVVLGLLGNVVVALLIT